MKKSKEKTKGEKFISFIDTNRKCIYGFIGGVLVAAIVATIIWPDRIATLEDGTQPIAEINDKVITADMMYEELKSVNSINTFIDLVDDSILSKKYELTSEMEKEVEDTANAYYNQYAQYGYSKEQILAQFGLSSHEEFIKVLTLNNRRSKYFDEYVKSLITDKDINDYYENSVYGDISSEHMLAKISDDLTDADAKTLAEEIISKLNEGKSFDEVKEEYKDKITYENLNYQGFNSNIQDSYMDALKKLENGKYTTEPVKTTYGYHVIHRIDQKEKAALEDIKDEVIEKISDEKKSADQNLYYKSLIHMREENGLKFSDTVFEDKYNAYIKKYK